MKKISTGRKQAKSSPRPSHFIGSTALFAQKYIGMCLDFDLMEKSEENGDIVLRPKRELLALLTQEDDDEKREALNV